MFNDPYYAYPFYSGVSSGFGPGAFSAASGLSRAAGGSGLGSLLRGAASRWSWNGFLTSTGKALNVINQAIPIVYQVRPMINNAKTMFRVLGAVRENGTSTKTKTVSPSSSSVSSSTDAILQKQREEVSSIQTPNTDGGPTFFL